MVWIISSTIKIMLGASYSPIILVVVDELQNSFVNVPSGLGIEFLGTHS